MGERLERATQLKKTQQGSDSRREAPCVLVTLMASDAGHDRESGQSTVEFALILFPLLLLVAGIIQFGIALNYWLDMQRVANQGARWAAVNNWPPDCPRGSSSCTSSNTLQATLQRQMLTKGLQNHSDHQRSALLPERNEGAR